MGVVGSRTRAPSPRLSRCPGLQGGNSKRMYQNLAHLGSGVPAGV